MARSRCLAVWSDAALAVFLLSRTTVPFPSPLRRRRPLPSDEAAALASYRERVAAIAQRVGVVRDEWLETVGQDPVDAQVANVASVHRWELSRLASEADALVAPVVAANVHQQVRRALSDAARGCQLLATGSRFHKSEAICDGQVLLVGAAETLERMLADLDARLTNR